MVASLDKKSYRSNVPKQLSPKIEPAHLREWVEGSGISEAITRLNLKSIFDPNAIAKLLNWKKYNGTPGWYVQGIDSVTGEARNFGQFKPDQPIQFPDQDKPHKYFSFPKGSDSEAICTRVDRETWQRVSERYGVAMPENILTTADGEALGFWAWVLDHPEIPVTFTEGIKKACCLLSEGYVALCLVGVWNGQKKKKKIIPTLEPFTVPGRVIYLVFDADVVVKAEVQAALKVLGHLLVKTGCVVYVVTWDLTLGKGIDDVLVSHAAETLKAIMDDAQSYSQWLKGLEAQFNDAGDAGETKNALTKRVPPADKLAKAIAEDYRTRLLYNDETGAWMRYEADFPGVWSPESNEFIEATVSEILDSRGIEGYDTNSYVVNVAKKLRHKLFERKWVEPSSKELIPFENGVLEISTGKLLEHSPGYRFTWCIPRQHNPLANDWNKIDDYLDALSQGNKKLKEIYLCFANAVLKGRADLQKFLHLIGLAGSGKGTYARLITDLIGQENILSTTLEDWCNNRFESANGYRKRLVVFWDEDKQVGKLGKFLSLMGGDWIRGEEKGKKAFQYRYDGLCLVLSNMPIFMGSAAARVARRAITVPCNNQTPKSQIRDLNREFQSELDAFTNYVLSIPDERVTQVLRGLTDTPECTAEFWENRMRVDSIAAWLNEWVIRDATAQTLIGMNKDEGVDQQPETLYGSYSLFCRQSGMSAKSHVNFSPDLIELCNTLLGWEVEKVHTNKGKAIRGLRLRNEWDGGIPTHDAALQAAVEKSKGTTPLDEKVTVCEKSEGLSEGLSDGLYRLQDKAFSESEGLALIPSEKQLEQSSNKSLSHDGSDLSKEVTIEPSQPLKPLENQVSQPFSETFTETFTEELPSDPPAAPIKDNPLYGWDRRHARKPYPNVKSDNVRSSQKRALAIRETILAARCINDLAKMKRENGLGGEFSHAEIKWVVTWIKRHQPCVYQHYEQALKVEQPKLWDF